MQADVKRIADKHHVSLEAVRQLLTALQNNGGISAVFDVPELGGMGEWSINGVARVGDGHDVVLNSRVDAICRDLWDLLTHGDDDALQRTRPPLPLPSRPSNWWPDDWREKPDFVTRKDGFDFAYFAKRSRLAMRRGVRVRFFDTSDHKLQNINFKRELGHPIITVETSAGKLDLSDLREVRS